MWLGAAALCRDDLGRVLLVRQGTTVKKWGLPGGGAGPGESLQTCCQREVWEETGYRVGVGRELGVKTASPCVPVPFELHIFEVSVTGGRGQPRDPDGLIDRVGWFTAAEVRELAFHFPEDRDLILWHAPL